MRARLPVRSLLEFRFSFFALFCSKPSICRNLFVCHVKFSTILASIPVVFYELYSNWAADTGLDAMLRAGISEARLSPVHEAIREVAPLHARPRSRSARIGSFYDLVAALVWV